MSEADFLRKVILNVFKEYADQDPSRVVSAIERRCGFALSGVDPANVEMFIQAVAAELTGILTDEWKAGFVTTVIRNVLRKQGLVA